MIARASMAVIAALLFILPAAPRMSALEAQAGGAVPREAMALLLAGPEGFGSRPFDLRVGSAPAGFPGDLLPTGALVRVSAGIDGLAAVVAVAARFSADDRVAFEQQLEAGGWINPLRPAGFAAREAGPSLSLCRGDRFATLSFLTRSEGGSYVRASVATEPGRACLVQAPSVVSTVPLPSMPVPADARSGRASMGGTSDAMYTSIRLTTRQSVEAISAHYVRQLTSAGWTVEGRTADGAAMSVTRLRAAGTSGASATALLVITAVDGSGEVDVLLRLVQPQGSAASRDEHR
jgi:hypothetical protein